jgi:hypothetical protein
MTSVTAAPRHENAVVRITPFESESRIHQMSVRIIDFASKVIPAEMGCINPKQRGQRHFLIK